MKENVPFDVSKIKDELNDYIDQHRHRKLLNEEMDSAGYMASIIFHLIPNVIRVRGKHEELHGHAATEFDDGGSAP